MADRVDRRWTVVGGGGQVGVALGELLGAGIGALGTAGDAQEGRLAVGIPGGLVQVHLVALGATDGEHARLVVEVHCGHDVDPAAFDHFEVLVGLLFLRDTHEGGVLGVGGIVDFDHIDVVEVGHVEALLLRVLVDHDLARQGIQKPSVSLGLEVDEHVGDDVVTADERWLRLRLDREVVDVDQLFPEEVAARLVEAAGDDQARAFHGGVDVLRNRAAGPFLAGFVRNLLFPLSLVDADEDVAEREHGHFVVRVLTHEAPP